MTEQHVRVLNDEALALHADGRPGKFEIKLTKPLNDARALSLAYSPGVAAPCRAIKADPDKVYDYTAKGNVVGIVTNGTAVLGLGNLGTLGAKPVMEGKAVLFKRFADIDGIDLGVATEDVDEFVNCVKLLGASFGGINLEDIKAPECFEIERRLSELMDIPIFHDDQHGTAIISGAGLLNGLEITGRDIKNTKIVMNGAGAAAIACAKLFISMGLQRENLIMCDTKGVISTKRTNLNEWKILFANDTSAETLAEVMAGADVFVGLSAKGAVTGEMVSSMNDKPLIFAMANPDPEITPEEVKAVRSDAIVATGRSDYPNQINNVLG
ncbi:MAG TPA: NADP-dependent malic enzyme, partial [Rhodospirillaceae bacterium]|nr:NADP-dependent malic enzyme [Rhodospirillaceae bacterium]